MIEFYTKKGMPENEAETTVRTMAKYKDLFIDVMMVEELGILPEQEDDDSLTSALWTFGMVDGDDVWVMIRLVLFLWSYSIVVIFGCSYT